MSYSKHLLHFLRRLVVRFDPLEVSARIRALAFVLMALVLPIGAHAAYPNLDSFSATDGTSSDRIELTIGLPSFTTPYLTCVVQYFEGGTYIDYITITNEWDHTNASTTALATITAGPMGTRNFSARLACANDYASVQAGGGTLIGATLNDWGHRSGIPFFSSATRLTASTGTNPSSVVVDFSGFQDKEECETGVEYVISRDGAVVATVPHPSTATFNTSPITWTDTGVSAGDHRYEAKVRCAGFPARASVKSSNDAVGFITPVARPVISVSASDMTYPDRVDVTFSAPSQAPDCQAVSYTILRNGTSIGTVSSVPVTGGVGTFQDTTATPATIYTYGVQTNCTIGNRYGPTIFPVWGGYTGSDYYHTFDAPNLSSTCTAVSYVLRDPNGDHASSSSIPLTGATNQTVTWLGGASVAVQPTSVHAMCTYNPITSAPVTDPGSRGYPIPLPVSPVSATDGTLTDRVTVTFTAPNQSSRCSSIAYEVLRDGTVVGTSPFSTLTGGAGSYDDMGVSFGYHSYAVRSVCTPGATTADSSPDQGYRRPSPAAPTSLAASDYLYADRVGLSAVIPPQPQCSTIQVIFSRDGTDIYTDNSVTSVGGTSLYSDVGVSYGLHTYGARVRCEPGTVDSSQITDPGARLGVPPTPTISASDYLYLDKVTIDVTVAAYSMCANVEVVIARDGTDIGTIPGIPVGGGSGSLDDLTATPGVHSYAARSRCTDTGVASPPAIDPGSKAFPAPICSGMTLPSGPVTYSSGGTIPITVNNIIGAISARLEVYATQNGANDLYHYPISGAPTGTANIALANHALGSPEYGLMNVRALLTGSNPADVDVECATGTILITAGPPANFKATDGTVTDRVDFTWTPVAGMGTYTIYQCPFDSGVAQFAGPGNAGAVSLNAAACTPVVSNIPGANSSASLDVPGTTHQPATYVIHGVAADGVTNTALSPVDAGYPNRAPTSATAVGNMIYGSTADVFMTINVVDPNPFDMYDLSVVTATTPKGGTVVASGGSLTYTPPAAPFLGDDVFTFTATDGAGASVTGTATVSPGCPAPTVGAITTSPLRIFAGTPFAVRVNYGNQNCAHNHDATLQIIYAGSTQQTLTSAAIPAAVAGTLTFNVPNVPSPGLYIARATVTNTVTGLKATKDYSFTVVNYSLPDVQATPRELEFVEKFNLTVVPSPDCPLTTSSAEAAADTNKCLVEVSGLPPGIAPDGSAAAPTWNGYATAAGSYTLTVTVSQYDASGTAHLVGTITKPTVVQPLSSLVFGAASPLTAKLHLLPVQSYVVQTSGVPCPVTQDVAAAQSYGALGQLRCLVTIGTMPSGFTPIPNGIYGTAHALSIPDTNWTVTIFDRAGVEHPVASGSIHIDVQPVDIRYKINFTPVAPIAAITNASGQVASIGADGCPLTVVESVAMDVASGRIQCLLEWGTLPAGLSQVSNLDYPSLKGAFVNSGTNTGTFTVSIFDSTGTKIPLFSGSDSIVVAPAPAPTVVLSNMRTATAGTYAVPLAGGFYGVLLNCPGCGSIQLTQTIAGDTTPRTGGIATSTGRLPLIGTPAALYSQRSTTLRVALAAAPTVFAEETFNLLTVPPEDTKAVLTTPGTDIPDTRPVDLSVKMGRYTRDGFTYAASDLGTWRVRFGVVDSAGVFQPLTTAVDTDATGTATGSIDPSGYVVMRLAAEAEAVTPIAGFVQKVVTPIRVARVVKGTPIDGTLSATATDGPAPLLSTMKVAFTTRADQVANESVIWQSSPDGGSTWTDIPGALGGVYSVRAPAGSSTYRVQFKNRNTGDLSFSAPVTITAWDLPRVDVAGATYAFPGTTMTLNASAKDGTGAPVSGVDFDWSVALRVAGSSPPPIATGTGPVATFTLPTAGAYMLTYRARYSTSPAADPRSWWSTPKQIIVSDEQKPFARLVGPSRAEVGKAYDYSASITTPFPLASSPLTVGGSWTLPDGTVVPGLTLSWTPTTADLALGRVANLRFSAWINGYEATTTATFSIPVQLWEYVFPEWTVTSSRTSPYAPSNFQFTAIPSNAAVMSTLEGLTYTWSVPPALRVIGVPTSKLNSTADFGGDYTVTLVVSDARGNTRTVTSTGSTADPPPFDMTIAVSKISKWSHAPLTVGITPKVTGGHPSDSILTWSYSVDGVPQTGLPNRPGVQIALPGVQTYNVDVSAVSKMGATVNRSVAVTVPANVPASCTITGTPSLNRLSVAIKANCTDPDGVITKYRWFVNGVEKTAYTGASWSYYLPAGETLPLTVDLTVTDDGGDTSTATVTVN